MTRRPKSQRPARFDDLGLRRALSDRLLPLLVAAMAFLAALALAGAVATATLAQHWRQGAASALTVQVPQPAQAAAGGVGSRADAVLRLLRGTPGIADARALTEAQLADLLRPWLGATSESLALPLPAVIAVRLGDAGADLGSIAARLDHAAPGTLLESHDAWMQRLSALAHSLQICAGAALLIVVLVAAAVIATATRAGLATRRDAIEIVHGLGATDGYIAGRFARRITLLAGLGAVGGALAALPVLLAMAGLAAPFASWDGGGAPDTLAGAAAQLPPVIWLALPVLPLGAAAIGWLTTQGTVRAWLRQLP